jgi:hypothetical protein
VGRYGYRLDHMLLEEDPALSGVDVFRYGAGSPGGPLP